MRHVPLHLKATKSQSLLAVRSGTILGHLPILFAFFLPFPDCFASMACFASMMQRKPTAVTSILYKNNFNVATFTLICCYKTHLALDIKVSTSKKLPDLIKYYINDPHHSNILYFGPY